MMDRLASEMGFLLDKAMDIQLDFKERDYTRDDLLIYLQKMDYSQDLHRLLKALGRFESSVQCLKKDLNDVRDIQQKYKRDEERQIGQCC